MSMLNFSLLRHTLKLLLLKHYYEIQYVHQKTDQMGIPKLFAYNILQNYPITIYSIYLESYDQGLSNKTKYMT